MIRTLHASERMAQRAFDDEMIDLIFKFGEKHSLKTAQAYRLGKKQTPRLMAYKDSIQKELEEQCVLLKTLIRLKNSTNKAVN